MCDCKIKPSATAVGRFPEAFCYPHSVSQELVGLACVLSAEKEPASGLGHVVTVGCPQVAWELSGSVAQLNTNGGAVKVR